MSSEQVQVEARTLVRVLTKRRGVRRPGPWHVAPLTRHGYGLPLCGADIYRANDLDTQTANHDQQVPGRRCRACLVTLTGGGAG